VARRVHEILSEEGLKITLTKEPTDSWLGQVLKEGFEKKISPFSETLLFTADRATHVGEIRKDLDNGISVFSDRYIDSTIAYQSVILGPYFRGSDMDVVDWLKSLWRPFALLPDVTFLFRAPPGVCLARLSSREKKTKFEKERFLEDVQKAYLREAENDSRFRIVDASKPIEDVIEEVMVELRGIFNRISRD
jgi:dTMP kinase